MKILALTKYGAQAASTRQRFQQYAPALKAAGMDLQLSPFLDNSYLVNVLSGRRGSLAGIAEAYGRRVRAIVDARDADAIWLHCEFLPYLPAFAEILAARTAGKPIVFDFDDAIFHLYDDHVRRAVRMLLAGKLEGLLRRVQACTCGNAYLRDYAARFCGNSMVVPTVVDTDRYRPAPLRSPKVPTIGWIGSPSTWVGVQPLIPVLKEVVQAQGARFLVVGAGHSADSDRFAGMVLRDWSEETEVADVQEMDVGIMPLLDRPFERGKSGYKLIQYMACGLPVVASPVGVNADIVKEGGNGFLASTGQEWGAALTRLLEDAPLRHALGGDGRKLAVEGFSLKSQAPRLVGLFKSLV